MLRDVVGAFLDSLTEREFDAPLLALLAARSFDDVHFTHGAFEFGKDVIAKRTVDGQRTQYALQSKAGDIGMSEWREIRHQIEEAQQNTLSHPNFDASLPRVAVLVTTGQLKGGATLDAQQLQQRAEARGDAAFEVWERPQLLDWFTSNPEIGIDQAGDELLAAMGLVASRRATEPDLERYARCWLSSVGSQDERIRHGRASVQAAVLGNRLRAQGRLDLAAYLALHFFRAAWAGSDPARGRPPLAAAAIRLFAGYVEELLAQAYPTIISSDPMALARDLMTPFGMVTYNVACCRLAELFGLLALLEQEAPDCLPSPVTGQAADAAIQLIAAHPGTARPVSDQFAVGIIPPALVAARHEPAALRKYLARTGEWIFERYEQASGGLGLASLDESEELVAERLLGGALESTTLTARSSSYAVTVLSDLALFSGQSDLHTAIGANVDGLRIAPSTTAANEVTGLWRRGGQGVWPQPRVSLSTPRSRPGSAPPLPSVDLILLASSARSRHDVKAIEQLMSV